MNEIINITYQNDRPTVSARELHDFLEVGARYNDWFPRMCEYGFVQGVDFNLLKNEQVRKEGNREVTRTVEDAQLTIEMAKEICMLQRNEKGKIARQYFIQLEKDWNSPEKVMARALRIAEETIQKLNVDVDRMRPKEIFADAVATAETSILVGDLAKLLKQNGVDTGQKRLFNWLRDSGYLIKSGSSQNMPTQKAMDMKLFEVKERAINNPDGSVRITRTTKVTGKGQQYFINKFLAANGERS